MPIYQHPQDQDPVGELYRRSDNDHDQLVTVRKRSHLGVWINPTLLNGWGDAGGSYHSVQYRKVFNDTLEFRGTIEGGASGSVAFILPLSHRPLGDISFGTDITDPDTGNISIARVSISSTTGEVTISWTTA